MYDRKCVHVKCRPMLFGGVPNEHVLPSIALGFPIVANVGDYSFKCACRDPVYDFAWVQSKTGTETMTISSDGRILWWDVRRLAEPTDELVLHDKLTDGRYGALSLSYNPAVGATR